MAMGGLGLRHEDWEPTFGQGKSERYSGHPQGDCTGGDTV